MSMPGLRTLEKDGEYCVPCVFFCKGDGLGKLVNSPLTRSKDAVETSSTE